MGIMVHKVLASWALHLGLKPRKAKKSVGLKNGLGLTHSKAQAVGLGAFVCLGAPFLNIDCDHAMILRSCCFANQTMTSIHQWGAWHCYFRYSRLRQSNLQNNEQCIHFLALSISHLKKLAQFHC